MNVEFLVHGTLSDGQSSWKDIDAEYCSRFYIPTSANELMVCEVTKRDKVSFSSYYSYLRYNNVMASSGRTGSYFGITVRLDDMICCDVVNMYNLLDTIFNKRIVGTLLNAKNDSYVYNCESFKSKEADLNSIETLFGQMCNSMFIAGSDFVQISPSYKRKEGKVNINLDDVTDATVRETLAAGIKLCVSPEFSSKQSLNMQKQVQTIQNDAVQKIKAAQEDCEKQISAKAQEMEQANKAASADKAILNQEIKRLEGELRAKDSELAKVRADLNSKVQSIEIIKTIKEIKEPITKLASLMAQRFPDNHVQHETEYWCDKKPHNDDQLSFFQANKKTIAAVLAVVVVALGICFGWYMPTMANLKAKDELIATQKAQIEALTSDVNFSKLKIDIGEYNGKDEGLTVGNTYHFKIKGDCPTGGVWSVNDTNITNDEYCVKKEDAGTELSIKYTCPDGRVISRTIKAVNGQKIKKQQKQTNSHEDN